MTGRGVLFWACLLVLALWGIYELVSRAVRWLYYRLPKI